jgi:hypothetical protein
MQLLLQSVAHPVMARLRWPRRLQMPYLIVIIFWCKQALALENPLLI